MIIYLAGLGPGSADLTTQQTMEALGEADLIITSRRLAGMLWGADPSVPYWDALREEDRFCFASGVRILVETVPGKICRILEEEPFERAVCLYGGDSSFYSGATPLLRLIGQSRPLQEKGAKIRILPGISSLSAACAHLGISFRELEVFSAHGRVCNPVKAVMNGKRSFFLTGGKSDPAGLCAELTRAGLGDLKVTVCERLSSEQEQIREMTAREASGLKYDRMAVLLAEPAPISEQLRRTVPGIPDDSFVRGSVPMTKRLVRVSALSLLDPSAEDLIWDLGAGTGSVSVELSPRCGRVISVEKDPEAIRLMEENRKKFGAWNMEIVQGEVPQILRDLPMPDRIFVGGGGGRIREVLEIIKTRLSGSGDCGQKTAEESRLPAICASAVTLETLQEVRSVMEESGYETQVVQVAVTDVKKRGHFHMMDAQNPVFLIAGFV